VFEKQTKIKPKKKECNTRTSQEVTHPSTTLAQAFLLWFGVRILTYFEYLLWFCL
jgi:hypothetical protein